MGHKASRIAAASVIALLLGTSTTYAQLSNWINASGGVYQTPGNWSAGVPGALGTAEFDLSSAGYTVTFSGSTSVGEVRIVSDTVTLDLSGNQYSVNGPFVVAAYVTPPALSVTGRLTVQDGWLFANDGVQVGGEDDGTIGFMTVRRVSASTVLVTPDLDVGSTDSTDSEGTLTVAGGAQASVNGTSVRVGRNPADVGTITVTGSGSLLNCNSATNGMIVGGEGRGSIYLESRGRITCSTITLGDQVGGEGWITMSGIGTTLVTSGALNIGAQGGDGDLYIEDGADITTVGGGIGLYAGSGYTAIAGLDGAGTTWTNSGAFSIGTGGPGTLDLDAGALFTHPNPDPYDVGPFGEVNVTGGGILRTGGTVTPGGTTTIGTAPGGTATVTVSGSGSTWEANGPVSIGELGAALVMISSGGVFYRPDPDPYDVGPFGQVQILSGSQLTTNGLVTLGTGLGGIARLHIEGTGSRWDAYGGATIGGGGPGDLTFDGEAVISIVGTGRAPGVFTVARGGEVIKAPAATDPSASITADTVEIEGSSCAAFVDGGTVTLDGKMTLETEGDLILTGSEEESCELMRGLIVPPPGLDSGCGGGLRAGSPTITVGGDLMMMNNAVSVSLCTSAAGRAAGTAITLYGNWITQNIFPRLFDAANAGVLLTGINPIRTFEVAGRNFGQTTEGFWRGNCSGSGAVCGGVADPTCPGVESCEMHSNFSLGRVEVGAGSSVIFVDASDNDTLGQEQPEALYVGDVVFQPGATVIVNNCSVFYKTVTYNGVTPTLVGTGEFLPVYPPISPPGPVVYPHNAPKNRYITIDATTNSTLPVAYEVTLSSMMRCAGDDRRACITDADCPGVCAMDPDLQCTSDEMCGGDPCMPTAPCVEHGDVGSVSKYVDTPSVGTCIPLGDCADQWFAGLADTPVYRVWTENKLHITACEIVPVAKYEIRATTDGMSFSESRRFGTIIKPNVQYGDVVGPVSGDPPAFTPPDGFTNVTDVQAYLIAVQGGPTAPPTTWVDLHGTAPLPSCSDAPCVVPQQILGVADLQWIKFGFLGRTYVETPGQENPGDCPP